MKLSTSLTRDLVFLVIFGGGFISGMIYNALMIGGAK